MKNLEFNFERVISNIESAPAILYRGSNYKSNENELSHKLPWSAIFTAEICNTIGFDYLIEGIRRPEDFKEISQQSKIVLSKRRLPIVYFNGNFINNSQLPQALSERMKVKEAHRVFANKIPQLLEGSFGMLVIDGYNLGSEAEVSIETLYTLFNQYPYFKIYFFGVTDEMLQNEYMADLQAKKNVIITTEAFDDLLQEHYDDTSDVSKDFFDIDDKNQQTFFINGKIKAIANSFLLDTFGFATLLTNEILKKDRVGSTTTLDWFLSFLTKSPTRPEWYGYLPENRFFFERDFEVDFYTKVENRLQNREFTDGKSSTFASKKQKVVLLSGQTCCGKSIALAHLATEIFFAKKYPVVYINNPTIFLGNGSENFIAIDNLFQHLESEGAESILLIWDTSIYDCRKNEKLRDVLNTLVDKGRKVVLVGTALQNCLSNDYDNMLVSINLSDKEKENIINLLTTVGKVSKADIKKWIKETSESNLLTLLYRFLSTLHPELRRGIHREVAGGMQEMSERFESIPKVKPEITEIQRQMQELGLFSSSDSNEALGVNDKAEKFNTFMACIAIASSYRLRIPITLALRILGDSIDSSNIAIKKLIFSATCLSYFEPEPSAEYAVATIGFRTPLEAKLFLIENNIREQSSVDILCKIIGVVSEGNYFTDEISFIGRLIQMIGPNSDDLQTAENANYERCYPSLISSLETLRANGILEPILLTQELTLIREYYYSTQEPIESEVRAQKIHNAIVIANDLISKKNDDYYDGFIGSLIVEAANSELRLKNLQAMHPELKIEDEKFSQYPIISNNLKWVINARPNNTYAYNAFFKLVHFKYNQCSKVDEKIRILKDGIEVIDISESASLDVITSSYYIEPAAKVKALLGDDSLSSYLDTLIGNGNAIGVYIKSYNLLERNKISLTSFDAFTEYQNNVVNNVIKLIQENDAIAKMDFGCQYLLLRAKWLVYNREPLFPGIEKRHTKMNRQMWEDILITCENCYAIINRQERGSFANSRILLLLSLAYIQTDRYGDSLRILDEIEQKNDQQNLNILGQERMKVWYIVSEEDGTAKKFKSTITTQRYNSEKRSGYAQLEKISKGIYYFLPNLKISRPSGVFNDIELGIGYRGFSLFRELLEDKNNDRR